MSNIREPKFIFNFSAGQTTTTTFLNIVTNVLWHQYLVPKLDKAAEIDATRKFCRCNEILKEYDFEAGEEYCKLYLTLRERFTKYDPETIDCDICVDCQGIRFIVFKFVMGLSGFKKY